MNEPPETLRTHIRTVVRIHSDLLYQARWRKRELDQCRTIEIARRNQSKLDSVRERIAQMEQTFRWLP